MICYISHPYSAPTEEERLANANFAIDVALELREHGIHSLVPNLSHWIDLRAQERGISLSWDDYLEWDLELLEGCDCLLVLGDSPGCRRERDYALELGMRVFTSVGDVIDYAMRTTNLRELVAEAQELDMGY